MLEPDKQICIKNLESRIKYLISSILIPTLLLSFKKYRLRDALVVIRE